jgi:uncharacterized Zn-binding protein involved in type VI secretion
MPLVAHLGDRISHGGAIVSASETVFAEGRAVARVTDRVMCAAHGAQTIRTGAESVQVNGLTIAIDGSICSCGARVVVAGGTVFAEGG